jgi:hypothetical protein
MSGNLGDGVVAEPLVLVYRDWLLDLSDWPSIRMKWVGILVMALFAELLILVYAADLSDWPRIRRKWVGILVWHCLLRP